MWIFRPFSVSLDGSWQSEVINNGIGQFCQSWVINNFALFWCLMFLCVFFLIFDKMYFDFKRCQYLLLTLILLHSNLSLSNTDYQWSKVNHPRFRQTGHLTLVLLPIPTSTCLKTFLGHNKLGHESIRIISCQIQLNFSHEWMKPFNGAEFSTIIDI